MLYLAKTGRCAKTRDESRKEQSQRISLANLSRLRDAAFSAIWALLGVSAVPLK
jgi:hypothetical protein